jgi:excisionase family DNA binding protein
MTEKTLSQMCEMLTARELEALLKIDVKTIYGYVQQGLIPYVRIQSNVRFRRQEILDWIEERSYRPRLMSRGARERKTQ